MAKKSKIKKQASFTNPDQNMQPIDITEIAGDGFGKYAEYVIIQRSLPDVRDGLIPVQRRNLFGMHKRNWSSKKPYVKSAKIVGEVMGSYHPHGDSAIYGALARMSKEWLMGIPMVDMSGNNGSIDGDSEAAMRYCITGDALVSLADGSFKQISEIVKNSELNTTTDIELSVLDSKGKPVTASKFFNSGKHDIKEIILENGNGLKGSYNHPVLTLISKDGVPTLEWKLLENIKVGDFVVQLLPKQEGFEKVEDLEALVLGAMISEGSFNENRITFSNTDKKLFDLVYNYLNTITDGKVYTNSRILKSRKEIYELDIQNKSTVKSLYNNIFKGLEGVSSKDIYLTDKVLSMNKNSQAQFLSTLFEGDGSVTQYAKENSKYAIISYSSISKKLVKQIQTLLFGLGINSRIRELKGSKNIEYRLDIIGYRNIINFQKTINFYSYKSDKLNTIVNELIQTESRSVNKQEKIPFITEYIRSNLKENVSKELKYTIKFKNFDTIQNKNKYPELVDYINFEFPEIAHLFTTDYIFTKVSEVNNLDKEVVYSIKVDSEEHSFIANGIVNHNTESRLSSYSEDLLLSNLSLKGIVPEKLNYDDTLYEPIYLPAKVPNILINGSEGIAVGYASNIPTFNLNEVLDACIAELRNPNIEDSELITYIPAPDFSTGGTIADYKSYADALISGRGGIKVRGNYTIEEDKKNKEIHIIFHEIPYGSVKPKIINTVIESINNKEISGIKEIRDDSDLDTGVSLVVSCNESANIDGILSFLFSKTDLQRNVPLNITAISKNKPKVLGVTQIIRDFNVFRKETFIRGLQIQIKELEFKKHLNEGFVLLVDNIEQVIELIKNSDSKSDAFEELLKIGFSKVQAKRVLDMSLHRINKSDKESYESIVNDCQKQIDQRNTILASDELITQAIIKAYEKIQKEYEIPRKTILKEEPENWDFSPESVIPKENMAVGITKDGFIKVSNFRSYKTSNVENDGTDFILETDTTQSIIIITEKGECAYIPVHKLPTTRWSDNGKHLSTFGLDIGNNEIAFAETYDGKDKDKTIFLIKDSGVGKQSLAFDYVKNRGHFTLTSGIKCKDDEKVLGGWLLDKNEDNFIALMDNQYANMYFEAEEMPITSVKSGGANAMRLNKKQGRLITEFKVYHNTSEIPPFCKPRERGQAGWNRKKTEEPVSLYDFKPLEQENEDLKIDTVEVN